MMLSWDKKLSTFCRHFMKKKKKMFGLIEKIVAKLRGLPDNHQKVAVFSHSWRRSPSGFIPPKEMSEFFFSIVFFKSMCMY